MDDGRKWIDVGTTAIPRLLTERCIGSFLDRFEDRNDYRLRWIFHLTRYYVPNFDKFWAENLKMAVDLSERFDDVVILGNRKWTSYGRAFWNVIEQCQNDLLLIEDDKLWHKPFRLREIEAAAADIMVFSFPRCKLPLPGPVPFTTAPAFHHYHAVQWWREHYPADKDRLADRTFYKIFKAGPLKIDVLGEDYWEDRGSIFWGAGKVQKLAVAKGYIDPDTMQYHKVPP